MGGLRGSRVRVAPVRRRRLDTCGALTFVTLASTIYHGRMPPRATVTATQLRQGGLVISLLIQGHEIVLLHHGKPFGVIRPWTKQDQQEEGGLDIQPPQAAGKGETWPEKKFPTSHLKPTFSAPPQ